MFMDTIHFGIHARSIPEARESYVGRLGFPVLRDNPERGLLSARVGDIGLSIMAGASRLAVEAASRVGGCVILRNSDLEKTVSALRNLGVEVSEISEVSDFMRLVASRDPSGNLVRFASHLRDPMQHA